MEGSYNVTAPHPVTNERLTLDLASLMKGKMYLRSRIPAAILKLVLGEMSLEILKSATVSSDKIQTAGFSFMYPEIEKALANLTAAV